MRKLGSIALVVTGLVIIVQAIPFLTTAGWSVSMFAGGEITLGVIQAVWALAIVAAMMAIGIYLIRRHDVLAERWFADDDMPSALTDHGILRAGLAIVGVVLMAMAVKDLLGSASGLVFDRLQEASLQIELTSAADEVFKSIAGLVVGAVEFGIGLFLVLRNQALADRIWNVRPQSAETPTPSATGTCPECGAEYDPDDYADLATARCGECRRPLTRSDA